MFTIDKTLNRDALIPFVGEKLAMRGCISDVKMPEPNKRNICLVNVQIAPADNTIVFDARDGVTYKHLWIKDTRPTGAGYSCRIADHVQGYVSVKSYPRSDGSISHTLSLVPGLMTQSAYEERLLLELMNIRNSFVDHSTKTQRVSALINRYLKLVEGNQVLCFDRTQDDLLRELKTERDSLMRMGGIYSTNNRAGRRFARRYQKSIQNDLAMLGFA